MKLRTYLIIATIVVIASMFALEYFDGTSSSLDDTNVEYETYAQYKSLKYGGTL